MLVDATGQKHDDYGFAYTRGPLLPVQRSLLGLQHQGACEAAFKKWQTWKASQKKK